MALASHTVSEAPTGLGGRVSIITKSREVTVPTDGRVNRIILAYWPNNFEAAIERFRSVLGLHDLEGPFDPPGDGVRAMISFERGIEFITPCGTGPFRPILENHLSTRGEGLFTLVWGVGDLTAAETRAAAAGFPRQGGRIDCFQANPAWKLHYARLLEAPLPPVAAVNIILIEAKHL
jgi:hypothetical protein